ncbi:Asp-tRNA(Asn)/Glu-tRNA(Gln) amidotransferase subunit GatB [Candidatus Uhrbacteria bacterium]|nr:Asp-tRNA(Asn)/Glu-tRNA(Gln) amidotransferase subunit GatB [Candidatus Uhrbacteria bacterium]
MKLEPVIGLEIHVQLKTDSKMFCRCSNKGEFEPPNTTVCPVCVGHPGTLPVPNAKAVELGVLAGLALGGEIAEHSKFDRKQYFYPDLPKGYQISQFDLPIVKGGSLSVGVPAKDGKSRPVTVRFTRAHLEEDAAKLHHSDDGQSSLVDFNRAGTPLIECVTEPDMHSPDEAKAFLQELRLIMRYLGVSDADMEKGHLRCDANISLREIPDDPANEDWAKQLNPKTEIKNVNSFRSVERALEYEIDRQTKLWLDGKPPAEQTTRGWDDARNATVAQRSKEEANDYRYFPEPDLPPLQLHELADRLAKSVPELPAARRARLTSEFGFGESEAKTICDDLELADFVEQTMSELAEWSKPRLSFPDPEVARVAAGWMLSKLGGVLTDLKLDRASAKVTPENMAELIGMILGKAVTGTNALVVLSEMAKTGADPSIIAQEKDLGQIDDMAELELVAKQVIAANPKVVDDWRGGKANAIQFLVGQVMKLTRGKASPEVARQMLEKELSRLA